mgnify:FL=1
MQGLMLAAGVGKRLGKYTKDNTKCMLDVAGKTLIQRATDALKSVGINRLIMVVGYQRENLKEYIKENIKDMEIVFIDNPDYAKSNNIYSLYLAREWLKKDDTIMLESDLIYENKIIEELVNNKEKNLAIVAKYEQWMDGTVVTIDSENRITEFIEKADIRYDRITEYYKTVNIYKLSKEFSEKEYIPFLEAYMTAYGTNEYYELALKAIAHLSKSNLKALPIENIKWYEIDDAQDLDIANCLFSKEEKTISMYQKRFGGYWRFNNLKDYCYLVNPYFPTQNMLKKINWLSKELITSYPSGLAIQNINAGILFDIDESEVIVGNGAAELINVLGHLLHEKIAVPVPTFNEYIRCFKNCEIVKIDSKKFDYDFNIKEMQKVFEIVDTLVVINPDNPSGSFIKYNEIMLLIEKAKQLNKKIIIDESFIDFADENEKYTLLNSEILQTYKNLIVIKSIGKSYGVAGIRLGVLACGNKKLLQDIKENMAIWNINAYAEYFLQIIRPYLPEYKKSCNLIAQERKRFYDELSSISYLKVYKSQANYIMCKLIDTKAEDLANYLMKHYNILIKDLSGKEGFENEQYIRLAIKSTEDNDLLLKAMKKYKK